MPDGKLLAMLLDMNLRELYDEGGFAALKRLAEAANTDPQYLRQCAKGWRGKRPSPDLALRLIAAEPRLTLEDLYGQAASAAGAKPPQAA